MLGSSMVTAVSCAKVSWRTRSSFSASPAADAPPPPRPRAEDPLVEAATGSAGCPASSLVADPGFLQGMPKKFSERIWYIM
jgi:hypothetical protein